MKEKMMAIIYALKNKVNNKIYVGQTWQSSLQDRWDSGFGYHGCVKLQNAIDKHGKEKFYYEALTICGSQETANYWEQFFIVKFDSIDNGYNIKTGGSYGKHSEASKRKMSEAHKNMPPPFLGRNHSTETKKQISDKLKSKGIAPSKEAREKAIVLNTGGVHSAETRQKISKAKRQFTDIQMKEMKQMHEQGMSLSAIGRKFNTSYQTITKYIRGLLKGMK
jgi:group I intron endonuclease